MPYNPGGGEKISNMESFKTKRYLDEGKRLFEKITTHSYGTGGANTVIAYGELGAGKTTLLRHIVGVVKGYDKKSQSFIPETVIWRGREHDDWTSFGNKCVLHIHMNDYDHPDIEYTKPRAPEHQYYGRGIQFVRDDTNVVMKLSELPPIFLYEDAEELYHKLVPGAINVVYEPQDYIINDKIVTIITRMGMDKVTKFKSRIVDSPLFWIEFFYYLVLHKTDDFISVFFDEIDDLIEVQPAGIKWYLQLWFKKIMKNFRRRGISLYSTVHKEKDIGQWLSTKMQCRLYTRGAPTGADSLVHKLLPYYLEKGYVIIDFNNFGLIHFSKMDTPFKVIVNYLETSDLMNYLDNYDDNLEKVKREKKSAAYRSYQEKYHKELRSDPDRAALFNNRRRIRYYETLNVKLAIDCEKFKPDSQEYNQIKEKCKYYSRKIELLEKERNKILLTTDPDQPNTF